MVKAVVVPLDGSPSADRAAPIAAALARRWNAELVLATVGSLIDPARQDLERVAATLEFDGARLEVIEGEDVPAAIQGLAERVSAPAICMATHSRGRLGGAVLGSVAEALLRRIACEFVLVGPHCLPAWPADAHRMLACLDESAASETTLAAASTWSDELGLELWVGEVFHPLDVASAQAPYRFLDAAVERLGPQRMGVRVCAAWSRSAPDEIVHLARTLSVSMIAMGTHGRSGLARMALGSVTAAVAHDAPCPVLTVRSPDLH